MKPPYNEKDIRILKILQEDGRTSYSEIARRLGLSEAAVYARIQKMLRHGIIKGFKAVLDPEKLGLGLTAIVAIRAQPSKYDRVLREISEIPEVVEVYDVTGDYYCLAKLRIPDREALASILDKIGSMDGIVATETRIVLRTVKETYALPLK